MQSHAAYQGELMGGVGGFDVGAAHDLLTQQDRQLVLELALRPPAVIPLLEQAGFGFDDTADLG